MRGRGPYKVSITPQMKAHLMHVKQLLKEMGFIDFKVSEPMRRSSEDFIAASTKTTMVVTMLVRPTRTGKIEFRQFTKTASSAWYETKLKEVLRQHHTIRPVQFSRQLPFGDKTRGWAQYVDASDHELLVLYFGPNILKPRR